MNEIETMSENEANYYKRLVRCCHGNLTAMASVADVSRQTIDRNILKHDLKALVNEARLDAAMARHRAGNRPPLRASNGSSGDGAGMTENAAEGLPRGYSDRGYGLASK
jgi:hypothetical protein